MKVEATHSLKVILKNVEVNGVILNSVTLYENNDMDKFIHTIKTLGYKLILGDKEIDFDSFWDGEVTPNDYENIEVVKNL